MKSMWVISLLAVATAPPVIAMGDSIVAAGPVFASPEAETDCEMYHAALTVDATDGSAELVLTANDPVDPFVSVPPPGGPCVSSETFGAGACVIDGPSISCARYETRVTVRKTGARVHEHTEEVLAAWLSLLPDGSFAYCRCAGPEPFLTGNLVRA